MNFEIIFCKYLNDSIFLKYHDAQHLENRVRTLIQFQLSLDNDYQGIDSHSNPYLCLDCVERCAEKTFDPKILFYPPEKTLYPPAALVEEGYSRRREMKIVCEKNKMYSRLRILETYSAQRHWIFFASVWTAQNDSLIRYDPCRFVHLEGFHPSVVESPLCSCQEKGHLDAKSVEPGKIDITPVHNVDCAGFQRGSIQDIDIVDFSIRYVDRACPVIYNTLIYNEINLFIDL